MLNARLQPVRVVLRALALLHLADGATAPETARSLKKLTAKAVRSIAHRYQEGGLKRALYEKARPGAAPLLSPSEKHVLWQWFAAILPKAGLVGRSV